MPSGLNLTVDAARLRRRLPINPGIPPATPPLTADVITSRPPMVTSARLDARTNFTDICAQ